MGARASRTRSRTRIGRLLLVAAAATMGLPAPAVPAPALPAAADTVVVVVSAESPVVELPRQHLADIYLGRTSRFPDGERAAPIDLEPGAAERAEFYERFLGRNQAEIKTHWSKLIFTGRGRPPPDVENGQAVKARIADDPSAIGYIDAELVDESVRVVRVR